MTWLVTETRTCEGDTLLIAIPFHLFFNLRSEPLALTTAYEYDIVFVIETFV